MTFVVTLLAVVVVLLTVLVAGLLRSHAEILRRLHELGAGVGEHESTSDRATRAGARAPRAGFPPAQRDLPRDPEQAPDRRAADISGTTVTGDPVALRVTGVDHDTVLLFLSSGCSTCRGFWDALTDAGTMHLPAAARVVVVTEGPSKESPARIARRAPDGVTVVMSDAAYADYRVEGTPYVVEVEGRTGRVRGEGTGQDWPQVARMLAEATGDRAHGGRTGRRARPRRSDRASLVDDELIAAGIAPGDERLYRASAGGPIGARTGGAPVPIGRPSGSSTSSSQRGTDPCGSAS